MESGDIGEVERGEKTISVDALLRIAEAMQVGLGALVQDIDRGRKHLYAQHS